MTNYNSARLLHDAEIIGSAFSESDNTFIEAMGIKLLKMVEDEDVNAILKFKEGIEASMPGTWDEYWDV